MLLHGVDIRWKESGGFITSLMSLSSKDLRQSQVNKGFREGFWLVDKLHKYFLDIQNLREGIKDKQAFALSGAECSCLMQF